MQALNFDELLAVVITNNTSHTIDTTNNVHKNTGQMFIVAVYAKKLVIITIMTLATIDKAEQVVVQLQCVLVIFSPPL